MNSSSSQYKQCNTIATSLIQLKYFTKKKKKIYELYSSHFGYCYYYYYYYFSLTQYTFIMMPFGVGVCIYKFAFSDFFFPLWWTVTSHGFTVQGTKITVHTLFITVHSTVHALKNIKNGSHGTIHTLKNYFATVFSVFSFSNNNFNPNGLYII